MAHSRPPLPGRSRGRWRQQPNKAKASQPNAAARSPHPGEAGVPEENMVCPKLKRFWSCLLSALGFLIFLSGGALAQPSKFPKHLITLIVPSAPGGFLEIAARIVAKDVTDRTGTPTIVDFRPGGGGIVGLVAFKQAVPDGQTLLVGNS